MDYHKLITNIYLLLLPFGLIITLLYNANLGIIYTALITVMYTIASIIIKNMEPHIENVILN